MNEDNHWKQIAEKLAEYLAQGCDSGICKDCRLPCGYMCKDADFGDCTEDFWLDKARNDLEPHDDLEFNYYPPNKDAIPNRLLTAWIESCKTQ